MHIREQIFNKHNIKLPIMGGDGATIETCVIITADGKYDYISIQNRYINCFLGMGNWRKVKQSLIIQEDKKIDKIVIDYGGETIEYYFDITECF
ncbi:hypothetical protein [Flavobacterium aciduliphilum]|uniref:Uncharacterized protein n=1 Tax=Flavobacterium aciduliphilum TaxID=1101402 RepID=A0A328YEY2_9FLAO|nr:hypothetical protein [Flavobacterium aciduliphilum]RAR72558.1 hypothetical protein CLV55_105128 [Flavobacterium aciduliphilum]